MSAEFSPCGTYRYVLRRKIPGFLRWNRYMLFIMLNPSTADAEQDDPTIRRCIGFAKREGYTDLTVVNLFALKATHPEFLAAHVDPVGPENDAYVAREITAHRNGLIIAAWGSHPMAAVRGERLTEDFGPFKCLGTNSDGSPKHPLYLRNDQPILELS